MSVVQTLPFQRQWAAKGIALLTRSPKRFRLVAIRQDVLDVSVDHFGAKWLGNEACFVWELARAGPNMSRRDNERDVRPGLGDFASEREAVERSRHLHIGEQQDNLGVSRFKKLERGIAAISLEHVKPSLFEDVDRVHADQEVIIHYKR